MTAVARTLVFDTGPLRHFALRGWLAVLKFVADDRRVVIPESVEYEVQHQRHAEPALQQILDASWIAVDRSDDIRFVAAFAEYERRLVSAGRNRGECGVLALGRTRGCTLVLDDGVPRRIAAEEGIDVTGTLGLLCAAIRQERLTVPMVEDLADDLLSGTYYLPFGRGGFKNWAEKEGLIDYSAPS